MPLFLLAAFSSLAGAGDTCSDEAGLAHLVKTEQVRVRWQSVPSEINVGEPFELELAVCPRDATLVSVDATMPIHRHGMNYRPSIHRLGEGRWRVQGMVWHMSGPWRLAFTLEVPGHKSGSPVLLTHDISLR